MTDKTDDELRNEVYHLILGASKTLLDDAGSIERLTKMIVRSALQRLDAPGPRLTEEEWAHIVHDAIGMNGLNSWSQKDDDHPDKKDCRKAAAAIIDRLSAQPKETGKDWASIHTIPSCDDLMWFSRGNTFEGPRTQHGDEADYWDWWCYAVPPSLPAPEKAEGKVSQ